MSRLTALYQSVVGKKILVAVTGVVMLGFVVGHMAGNLKAFLPDPEPGVKDIDAYAAFLRSFGEPILPHAGFLWIARAVLLGSLVLHTVCVIQLSRINRAARPRAYAMRSHMRASRAAKSMLVTGSLVLAFIGFHLAHLSLGFFIPDFEHGEVFRNLDVAFSGASMAALYIALMAILSVHVFHGGWSLFQTLGLDSPDRNALLRRAVAGLAVLLFVGFASVPVGFAVGVLGGTEDQLARSEAPAGTAVLEREE